MHLTEIMVLIRKPHSLHLLPLSRLTLCCFSFCNTKKPFGFGLYWFDDYLIKTAHLWVYGKHVVNYLVFPNELYDLHLH